eukprot:Sdes_comp9064_c0_seq1m504
MNETQDLPVNFHGYPLANIFQLKGDIEKRYTIHQPIHRENISAHGFRVSTPRNHSVPIVIDNGSHQCRAGWGGFESPHLCFRNLVGKTRSPKDAEREYYIGDSLAD